MDTKLKISPHEIIFKTQKNIETSIPGFHSISIRFFTHKVSLKIRIFPRIKRTSLQDNVPIIFDIRQY